MRGPMPPTPSPAEPSRPSPGALVLPLATFTVLAWASQLRHLDVTDAQLYQVIARHMVEDGSWIHLHSAAGAPFAEHLPFGFWPMAVIVRLFSEAALPWWQLLVSLATLVLVGALSRALGGRWAEVAAMTLLAVTQHFFFLATFPILEPMLLLLATAAAAVWLAWPSRPTTWLLALLLCAGAVAVKGPFGALPFCSAVLARSLVDRAWKDLFIGAAIGALSAAPVLVFLFSLPEWKQGYLVNQLSASATGARTDGDLRAFFAIWAIVARFWPGLPLLLPAALVALGRPRGLVRWLGLDPPLTRACRMLGLTCLFLALGLSLPARKLPSHVSVAFPLLSVCCALPWAPRLRRLVASVSGRRAVAGVGVGLLCAAVAVVPAGLVDWEAGPPCVGSRELAGELSTLSPGQTIWVVSASPVWGMLTSLQAERWLVPQSVSQFDQVRPPGPAVALVEQAAWDGHPGEWVEVSRARGWVFARRP